MSRRVFCLITLTLCLIFFNSSSNASPLPSKGSLWHRHWNKWSHWWANKHCRRTWGECHEYEHSSSSHSSRTTSTLPYSATKTPEDEPCDDDDIKPTATATIASTSTLQSSVPSSTPTCIPSTTFNFITRRGNNLYDGDQPFRFVSANTPSLLMTGDRPNSGREVPDPFEQDDLMQSIAGLGGRVARTYTFSVGYHIISLRTYNEEAFVGVDNAIAAARRNGVRLIIPFINNDITEYNTGEKWFYGSYGAFAELRNQPKEAFFTNATLRQDFKDFITDVLSRINTVTGIRYGDDPTILAWEFGNELGGWTNPPPPADWRSDIAGHIKTLAPNTLVLDGTIGGSSRWLALQDQNIDILGNHYYGINDRQNMRKEAALAASYGKAFISGEFGLTDPGTYNEIMDETVSNVNVTGALIWSLRGHTSFGGFYVHSEGKNDTSNTYEIVSYHVPGFPADTTDKFGPEEQSVIPALRSRALAIQGCPSSMPHITPQAPVLFTANGGRLIWRGSAWAASYRIFRTAFGTEFNETAPLATGVLDRKSINRLVTVGTLWTDATLPNGERYLYKVQAVGVEGQLSPISNSVASSAD
ncbi:uncharacterized protein SPPG_05291 [Spizellomyces punctatus DAOM BR117]|uniref:mannan endo-1,4-beta-mannosidase n=1 Tax=Spizellomyces punctatus (strain DAOM BR117) TaxID=645134 RepID=A0A0L0HG87_SPIPD|nr:uncharacterized protein SPPG_05291 [Spizellomyces punctatus DAOM BR117]KNC99919.1 hypothetical protein SPPG_05291 [Spizellomyces punctatus DAOM BR117]|eukprot:XP_016607959.1 hypothetical protein SPPG_05291 [Spizellomyces punctatus DAOM BR117]